MNYLSLLHDDLFVDISKFSDRTIYCNYAKLTRSRELILFMWMKKCMTNSFEPLGYVLRNYDSLKSFICGGKEKIIVCYEIGNAWNKNLNDEIHEYKYIKEISDNKGRLIQKLILKIGYQKYCNGFYIHYKNKMYDKFESKIEYLIVMKK